MCALLAVLSLGCKADEATGPDPSPLADPFEELDFEACSDALVPDETSIATTYFVGEFTIVDDLVLGTETWTMEFDAEAQDDLGQERCRSVWSITGAVASPGACVACDFSFDLIAALGPSDCPEFLTSGFELMEPRYDVDPRGGAVTFTHWETGNYLGVGEHRGNRYTYVTDVDCKLLP